MNYMKQILTSIKIHAYNLIHPNQSANKLNGFYKHYDNICDDSHSIIKMSDEEFKQYRLNTLMYIKQCKNTYYKYTQNDLFNEKLYNSYKTDNNDFDSGETAFDDNDNISIFDKYILEYIKNRNDIMTFFQCKNIKINLKHKIEELRDFRDNNDNKDVLFFIDMTDKQIFDYCIETCKNYTINDAKIITLSMVFKYDNDYIKVKLNSHKKYEYHPRLILENFIK